MEAWVGVIATYASVMRALETEMLEQHGLPITWFDVLNRLEQAPGHRLRMHELEAASVFTRSGITRLSDRLEGAGLVRREHSTDDRRGVILVITKEGTDKLAEVWPDHLSGIEEHFGRHISAADAHALRRILVTALGSMPTVSTGHATPDPTK